MPEDTPKYDPFAEQTPKEAIEEMAKLRADPDYNSDAYHKASFTETPVPVPRDDPWKHRSRHMRCETCMWWARKGDTGGALGRCRRHAPTLSGYPATFADDWCGDHKLDETKL